MPRTQRLILRRYHPADLEPFTALNSDPRVMEFFPAVGDSVSTQEFMDRANAEIDDRGIGLWAVEISATGRFIGFTGIHHHDGDTPPFPCDEVGWRLAFDAWGYGYATEAARAAVALGFAAGLDEIVSFTVPKNLRSRAVMERIGMRRDPSADFDHPGVPEGSPLRWHVLYRLRREVDEPSEPCPV